MNENLPIPDLSQTTVAIVGVGLMGGSLAAALQKRNVVKSIIGVGRTQDRLDKAIELGLLDDATTDLKFAAEKADLIVVCTPVNRIVEDVKNIASLIPEKNTKTIITDVGSVKGTLCDSLKEGLPSHVEFLGSHPIAGSEKTGFEHSEKDLFVDRMVVITPLENNSEAATSWVKEFWKSVGANLAETSPCEHDEILARTSHIPHVVAAALASTIEKSDLPYTATGFQDTTRIAAGDPTMWTAILEANKQPMIDSLKKMESALAAYRKAIESDDKGKIFQMLEEAKAIRKQA